MKVLDSVDTEVDLKADIIEIEDQLHVDGNIARDTNNNVNCISGN